MDRVRVLVLARTAGLVACCAATVLVTPPLVAAVSTFREGVGYSGTQDTYLDEEFPGSSFGTNGSILVENNGGQRQHGLIRFDNIFGPGAGQIPFGSLINSASLTVRVTNTSSSSAQIRFHRMLVTWPENATWTSMSSGIQPDDAEARSAHDAQVPSPNVGGSKVITGLTAALQAWSDGATNHGWAILSNSSDGLDFSSSEDGTTGDRPLLQVDWSAAYSVSGRVFEDVNYGGGAGRDFATAAADAPTFTIGKSGVTVELYDAAGTFQSSQVTGAGGSYSFNALVPGTYTVRVVNGTVASSRPGSDGSELGVQTYRIDGVSEGAGDGAKKVGGERPSNEDAATNAGAQSLASLQGTDLDTDGVPEWTQSIVAVDASTASVGGIDFGFCFSVVVNTNDAGQGSLRQFILNANRLN